MHRHLNDFIAPIEFIEARRDAREHFPNRDYNKKLETLFNEYVSYSKRGKNMRASCEAEIKRTIGEMTELEYDDNTIFVFQQVYIVLKDVVEGGEENS